MVRIIKYMIRLDKIDRLDSLGISIPTVSASTLRALPGIRSTGRRPIWLYFIGVNQGGSSDKISGLLYLVIRAV